MNHKETTVIIKTQEGDVERPAIVSDLCPGLAICHVTFARFSVTHIKSGTRIGGSFRLFGDAFLLFARLALIAKNNDVSWDVDQGDIGDVAKKIYDSPVPFDNFTVILKGEERKQTCKEFLEGLGFADSTLLLDEEDDSELRAVRLLEKCEEAGNEQ